MRGIALAALAAVSLTIAAPQANAAGGGAALPEHHWSFEGLFGTYDRAALQRGFLVYKGICSTCHALKHLAYRNLTEIGFTEDQVKKIAEEVEIRDGPNDQGEMYDRPGKPSDMFKSPFPNDEAARTANNGALPPDLSLIVRAREGGADYVHGVLTGYAETPPPEQNACHTETEVEEKAPDGSLRTRKVITAPDVPEGKFYNKYFPGCVIAMPAPLSEDAVEYPGGVKATVEQMSIDVANFLAWASDTKMEQRKRLGVKVILFLILLTGLMYAVKRKVWADVH